MVNFTLRPLYPEPKTRYPLYRRLSGPQVRAGRARKILLPSGFDPRTVQAVYRVHFIHFHVLSLLNSCYILSF
jgi:hypothetical protein